MSYCAGVVDSDGYIGVTVKRNGMWQPSYQPRVQVKQVEPQAVDLFSETFGGHRYYGAPTAAKGRRLYVWSIHSAATTPVLTALLPFLRIKREQALNALEIGRVNASGKSRHVVPEVVPGEPMVTAIAAGEAIGMSAASVYQAVKQGTVPFIREGRSILIPESFLPIWRDRGSPCRAAVVTAELVRLHERAKALNRVGV